MSDSWVSSHANDEKDFTSKQAAETEFSVYKNNLKYRVRRIY